MAEFRHISPFELKDNLFKRIGKDWMLVTAKDPGTGAYNMMTCSWGNTGVLWNKPVAFVFIRPQRYTFGFAEKAEELTLCFFDEDKRPALQLCGSVSGRDHDKIAETGLTPVEDGTGVYYEEARLVLRCKKLYADFLREESYLDPAIVSAQYPGKDFHKMYICEILDVLER